MKTPNSKRQLEQCTILIPHINAVYRNSDPSDFRWFPHPARHFGQLYFAAGVAQTAQGRSGRGIDAARQAALLLLWRRHWGLSRDSAAKRCPGVLYRSAAVTES